MYFTKQSANDKTIRFLSRPVLLHTKPRVFVDDLNVTTGLINDVGIIKYSVDIAGADEKESPVCEVNLLDANSQSLLTAPVVGSQGTLKVSSPKLWWPRSMSSNPGYMYTLEVCSELLNRKAIVE